jgi:hypothetical protein
MSSLMLHSVISWKFPDVSEVLNESVIGISEMSFSFYQSTHWYIVEDCYVHTSCCENLKSHLHKPMPLSKMNAMLTGLPVSLHSYPFGESFSQVPSKRTDHQICEIKYS